MLLGSEGGNAPIRPRYVFVGRGTTYSYLAGGCAGHSKTFGSRGAFVVRKM